MLRILARIALALPAAKALYVAPGSPCAPSCGNVLGSTSPDDVVCQVGGGQTNGYNNDVNGVFQSCLQCEMRSGYATKDNYTDAMALLYNMRYTLSYCIFNYPSNEYYHDSPCATRLTCAPFMKAIQYRNLSIDHDGFDFCENWNTGYTLDFQSCTSCLQASGLNYLANFVTTIQAGCAQKPAPGMTVAVSGTVFSTDIVHVSTPSPTATINPDWFNHGALTLGAEVGIAIGGLIVLLMLAGVGIVWRGKRRRRAFLRRLEAQYAGAKKGKDNARGTGGWPSPQPSLQQTPGHREMDETPLSQRPLRGWDDSPMTLSTDKTFPRYFSPYSSQYNSPVSAQEGQQMPWPETAVGLPREIGMALADHEGQSGSSSEDKGKRAGEESYEMQNVDRTREGQI